MRGIRNRMTIMQIRGLQNSDVDPVAAIWLNTNLKTHDFIAAQYWKDNVALVKAMLSQAEVYVYETDRKIQGLFQMKCSRKALENCCWIT